MKKISMFFILALTMLSVVAFGYDVPTLDPTITFENLIDMVIALISNWKTLGTAGIAIAIINIAVEFLKSKYCGNWFGNQSKGIKVLVIACLGQAVTLITSIINGVVWYKACIEGLILTGFAVAIYELIIKIIKKDPSTSN